MTVSDRLRPFGTTIFAEMTKLALAHNAVNLAQGFPDFDGPETAKAAAIAAITAGHNQYARMIGHPDLALAVADSWFARTHRRLNPDAEITVTSGCTEAIAAVMLGLLNPGDEVVLFQPFYDSYRACVAMAGAVPRFVTLRPEGDSFAFDPAELERAFTSRTRLLLVNTPHNPTGKVFSHEELSLIAAACQRHGVTAVTDEVYEDLTYTDAAPHLHLATFPGMEDRSITLSSLGKTHSLTGWKVGWALAPPALSAGIRAAHQFLTFATATPLQMGAAAVIRHGQADIARTRDLFRSNRDRLATCLNGLGFRTFRSDGTYFIMASIEGVAHRLDAANDREFCSALTTRIGVAAIPPSVFYDDPTLGHTLVRFAYCKKPETIDAAIKRLSML